MQALARAVHDNMEIFLGFSIFLELSESVEIDCARLDDHGSYVFNYSSGQMVVRPIRFCGYHVSE